MHKEEEGDLNGGELGKVATKPVTSEASLAALPVDDPYDDPRSLAATLRRCPCPVHGGRDFSTARRVKINLVNTDPAQVKLGR